MVTKKNTHTRTFAIGSKLSLTPANPHSNTAGSKNDTQKYTITDSIDDVLLCSIHDSIDSNDSVSGRDSNYREIW